MVVACDETYRTTGLDGKTLEHNLKTTLIGINVKNHTTKALTPAVYAGEWQVSFSGTLAGWCNAKISANGDMSLAHADPKTHTPQQQVKLRVMALCVFAVATTNFLASSQTA